MKKYLLSFVAAIMSLSAMAAYTTDESDLITKDVADLDGTVCVMTNQAKEQILSLYGGQNWDIKSISLADWNATDYSYVLIQKVAGEDFYVLRMAKADATFYAPSWANPSGDGAINFQTGAGIFVGGNKGTDYGTDAKMYGVFTITKTTEGYEFANVGKASTWLVPGIGQATTATSVRLYSKLVVDYTASIKTAWDNKDVNFPGAIKPLIDWSAAETIYITGAKTEETYNALLQAIEEAKSKTVGQYGVALENPGAETTGGWTMVRDGNAVDLAILTNANNAHSGTHLFETAGWGPKSASMSQTVNLVPGKYLLSAFGMAANQTTLKISAGVNESAEVQGTGDGGADRWKEMTVSFQIDEQADVVISGHSATEAGQNWGNFDDFSLWCLAKPYSITSDIEGNGTVENPTSAYAGDILKFKATPDEGYVVATISINGTVANLAPDAEGYYSITMPEENVTIEVVFEEEQPEVENYMLIKDGEGNVLHTIPVTKDVQIKWKKGSEINK